MQLVRDFRHSLRTLARAPVFAAVVVLSLGVGIGVNTAIFSWVQALVLQPIPGASTAASFELVEARTDTGGYPGQSWLEYLDLRDQLHAFDNLIAFRLNAFNVGEAERLERTYGLLVSDNYFSALGLRPALGRLADVPASRADPVVVIAYDFWQSRLAGDRNAVGGTLRVNGVPLTVIGVAPRGFQGTVIGLDCNLWVPATIAPTLMAGSRELDSRDVRGYQVMGTLVPATTRAAAQGDVDAVMSRLAHDFPETNHAIRGEVLPFWQAPRGPQQFMVQALGLLQAVMLLVLLAVCGNTANLVLARASARQQEIGVRLALGAGRWRVVSLLVTESLVLALAGAAIGVAIAMWGTETLRAVPMPQAFPIRFQTRIDGVSLIFAALLAIACGLSFGIPAAIQLTRVSPQQAMRAGARAAARSRMRETLVGIEVALALAALIVAAYFVKSFNSTRETETGFRRDGVLLAAYDLSGRNLPGPLVRDFVFRLLEGVRALPEVESAAIASAVPLDIHGLPLRSFTIDGRAAADGRPNRALVNTVTPGYFDTMGIALREGADFADVNDRSMAQQAIVNETFARRYIDGSGLGRRLESGGRSYTIAGIVADSLYESFGEPPTPIVYYSYRDRPTIAGEIHLRSRAGGEAGLGPAVRRLVRDLDPALPLYNVRTLNDHIDANLVFRRVPARMFAVLGPLLLMLAAIGIYAVVSYTVSLRTSEMGLRLALGAPTPRLIAEVVGQSFVAIGLGALAGWLLAFVMALDVVGEPIDPVIFGVVPVALLLVAALACWIPARRAASVDPVHALRQP